LGGITNYYAGFWPAFALYLIGVILIAGHFFFGPLRSSRAHGKRRHGGSTKSTELN
jgi:hypothetical protein